MKDSKKQVIYLLGNKLIYSIYNYISDTISVTPSSEIKNIYILKWTSIDHYILLYCCSMPPKILSAKFHNHDVMDKCHTWFSSKLMDLVLVDVLISCFFNDMVMGRLSANGTG